MFKTNYILSVVYDLKHRFCHQDTFCSCTKIDLDKSGMESTIHNINYIARHPSCYFMLCVLYEIRIIKNALPDLSSLAFLDLDPGPYFTEGSCK